MKNLISDRKSFNSQSKKCYLLCWIGIDKIYANDPIPCLIAQDNTNKIPAIMTNMIPKYINSLILCSKFNFINYVSNVNGIKKCYLEISGHLDLFLLFIKVNCKKIFV